MRCHLLLLVAVLAAGYRRHGTAVSAAAALGRADEACDSRAWDLASRQESNGQREPGWRLTLENGASQRRIISDRLSGHQRGLATRSGLQ